MKPFFPYQGGKRLELKIIRPYCPPHYDIMIDAFAGGGSVLLDLLDHGTKFIFNDINPSIVNIYSHLHHCDETFINDFNNIPLTEDFKNSHYSSLPDHIKFLFDSKTKYRGILSSNLYTFNRWSQPTTLLKAYGGLPSIKKYMTELSSYDIIFKNEDFHILLNEYKDNEKVFIYLDPPYLSSKKSISYYGGHFSLNDYLDILSYMKASRCKIMLNCDYTGWTRETFTDFFKFAYVKNYFASPTKQGFYSKYHLICSNY